MWLLDLPTAFPLEVIYAPLWHVKQVVAATMVWSILAGLKLVKFLWQLSHNALVGTWLDSLYWGVTLPNTWPLWQVRQAPGSRLMWLNDALVQTVVLWQLSHCAVVKIWLAGLRLIPGGCLHCGSSRNHAAFP